MTEPVWIDFEPLVGQGGGVDGPEDSPGRVQVEFDTIMPDWVGWSIAGFLLTLWLTVTVLAVVVVLR